MGARKSPQGRYEVVAAVLVLDTDPGVRMVPSGERVDLDDETAERLLALGAVKDTRGPSQPALTEPTPAAPASNPPAAPTWTPPSAPQPPA